MGMNLFSNSSSSYDTKDYKIRERQEKLIKDYTIKEWSEINGNLVVLINYKTAINYEGNKVLLYRKCTIFQLRNQSIIDPHFTEDKKQYSPFARFEPTKLGYETACRVALFNFNL